jgi:hypothetical protein
MVTFNDLGHFAFMSSFQHKKIYLKFHFYDCIGIKAKITQFIMYLLLLYSLLSSDFRRTKCSWGGGHACD